MSKKLKIAYMILLALLALSVIGIVFCAYKADEYIRRLQSDQVKIEKRINNLTQAMQTKDKELEAGMRNNYTGLMYKIEFIERETGVSE